MQRWVVSESSWGPHTPPSSELSSRYHGDLIRFHLRSTWWSKPGWKGRVIPKRCRPSLKAGRGWDIGSHTGTWFGERVTQWECCGSNTRALPGNSSMPVQQITVVPAKETASNGKSAPRSKDRNEVSSSPVNILVRLTLQRCYMYGQRVEVIWLVLGYWSEIIVMTEEVVLACLCVSASSVCWQPFQLWHSLTHTYNTDAFYHCSLTGGWSFQLHLLRSLTERHITSPHVTSRVSGYEDSRRGSMDVDSDLYRNRTIVDKRAGYLRKLYSSYKLVKVVQKL